MLDVARASAQVLAAAKPTTRNEIDQAVYDLAREDFALFRRLIRPKMIWGWWTEEVARQLQRFYNEWSWGKRPKLALQAPPQHGKSWSATDFIAWTAGRQPDKKTIFGSYSDDLGVRTNMDLQRIYGSDRYRRIFPELQISGQNVVTMADYWKRNSTLIEYIGHSGSFRNTTVNGKINGMELHLGVIDDPVKGRAEAQSKLVRDKTWDWFVDDFMGRFAKDGGCLVIMTRWHVDDLLGRALERMEDFRELRYPAIAVQDEPHRKKGEPLFPEHKPLDFLMERRKLQTESGWESLYQQSPIIVGGGILPIDKLRVLPVNITAADVKHTIRYVDKAGTEDDDADYTACVLMHGLKDGRFVISHIARGQWSALDRERRIETLARADHATWPSYELWVEQEPGSGGKESAEGTIRRLAGVRTYADKVTGDKVVRAEPFAAQVQGGNVWLVAGEWVWPFLDECEVFPNGKHKDQVDAAAGAFAKLALRMAYNTNYAQWL